MYEKELAFINKRIDELTEKTNLRKRPKLKRFKSISPLASSNALLNRLYINENFLEQWQQGIYDENDIDAVLAHEFGHLVGYQKSRFKAAKGSLAFLYVVLLLLILVLYWSLRIPEPGLITALIMVGWFSFMPWIVRKTYVPSELEADHNAVIFKLAGAQQLADALLKRISKQPRRKLGPIQTLEVLENMLTHPSLSETFQNLGVEIKWAVMPKEHESQIN